ncbi:AAA domain-containing protein, partial [Pelagophyceae sp. CCMP2097]
MELVPLAARLATAIVDEAGTVPEARMPSIAALGVRRLVLVGDHRQLRPFSRGREAPDGFFQRLGRAAAVPMLTQQYRMHPDICAAVSGEFYGGALETPHAVAADRRAREPRGLAWLGYDDADAEKRCGTSYENRIEAALVVEELGRLATDPRMAAASILVLAFHKPQAALIRKLAKEKGLAAHECVYTVDAAQGAEADYVVLSCVRSNRRGAVGFVGDANRFCVAISRAKYRLVVVGHAPTM